MRKPRYWNRGSCCHCGADVRVSKHRSDAAVECDFCKQRIKELSRRAPDYNDLQRRPATASEIRYERLMEDEPFEELPFFYGELPF